MLFYLTRSMPQKEGTGGEIVRWQTVESLRKNGISVTIVTPNYSGFSIKHGSGIIQIPYPKLLIKPMLLLESLGLIKDYMSPWAFFSYLYLRSIVCRDDILLSTSGGEIGCALLGRYLKNKCGSRHILNLHDPFNHTYIDGHMITSSIKHVNRDSIEKYIFESCDSIYTSSLTYCKSLRAKYSKFNFNINNWYFGYYSEFGDSLNTSRKNHSSSKIKIVYAGNMNEKQSPKSLIENALRCDSFDCLELHFFGGGSEEGIIKEFSEKYENITYHGFQDKNEISRFCFDNIDLAYLPLNGEYFKNFVPSKLYDYISMTIPIIAYVSEGSNVDDIIKSSKIGFSVNNSSDLVSLIDKICLNKGLTKAAHSSLKHSFTEWTMDETIKPLILDIKSNQ